MGIDYYGVLQIPRNSTNLEVKKAYRKLALEFNPERLKNENVKRVFALLGEGYEVLSDNLRRAVYDQYGEEGLKRGVPGPEGFIEPYHYHGDPMRTYKSFFGTSSPYADLLDYLHDPQLKKHSKPLPPYKPEAIKHPLALTLHEIYFGGVKKMKIHRLVFLDSTKTKTDVREKILSIPIKPGIKTGTKIICPEEGDQGENQIPADVVFIVETRPDDRFERENDDLIMRTEVSLEEALVGTVVEVNTIDHRKFRVPITDVIDTNYEKVIAGEGLPILEQYPQRGDLKIRFNINFPKYMPRESKKLLHEAFEIAKVGGGFNQFETINKLILADKILRVDEDERKPPQI